MIRKSISHIVCTRKLAACRTLRTRKLCVHNEEKYRSLVPDEGRGIGGNDHGRHEALITLCLFADSGPRIISTCADGTVKYQTFSVRVVPKVMQ